MITEAQRQELINSGLNEREIKLLSKGYFLSAMKDYRDRHKVTLIEARERLRPIIHRVLGIRF